MKCKIAVREKTIDIYESGYIKMEEFDWKNDNTDDFFEKKNLLFLNAKSKDNWLLSIKLHYKLIKYRNKMKSAFNCVTFKLFLINSLVYIM